MIILGLVILTIIFYIVGGLKEFHTLFRDIGSSLCIVGIMYLTFGFSWLYIIAFGLCWVGFSLGDDFLGSEGWYWSIHGFFVGLAMCVVSLWLGLVVAILSAGATYFVSRFFSNKLGADVILRGLLYATLPLTLKMLLHLFNVGV